MIPKEFLLMKEKSQRFGGLRALTTILLFRLYIAHKIFARL